MKPPQRAPIIGYRTEHSRWWGLESHRNHEVEELGTHFPDISHLKDHEGIWVTHTEKDAKRYGNDVVSVDLTGATQLHSDGDNGYMYVRPKKGPQRKPDTQ